MEFDEELKFIRNSISIDLSEWYFDFNQIGKGSYSNVYSAICKVTNIKVRINFYIK